MSDTNPVSFKENPEIVSVIGTFDPYTQIINILGTKWTFKKCKYDEDGVFKERNCDAICHTSAKKITVCEAASHPAYTCDTPEIAKDLESKWIRHELIHAFLYESGLDVNSLSPTIGWAINEEMVDWFAIQLPKIVDLCKELGAL